MTLISKHFTISVRLSAAYSNYIHSTMKYLQHVPLIYSVAFICPSHPPHKQITLCCSETHNKRHVLKIAICCLILQPAFARNNSSSHHSVYLNSGLIRLSSCASLNGNSISFASGQAKNMDCTVTANLILHLISCSNNYC